MVDISSLPEQLKAPFLARLAHELTVCARSTYEAGTENILEPQVLRGYNELLHRVTACIRSHLTEDTEFPVSAILEMARGFGIDFNRTQEIEWALKMAFEQTVSPSAN